MLGCGTGKQRGHGLCWRGTRCRFMVLGGSPDTKPHITTSVKSAVLASASQEARTSSRPACSETASSSEQNGTRTGWIPVLQPVQPLAPRLFLPLTPRLFSLWPLAWLASRKHAERRGSRSQSLDIAASPSLDEQLDTVLGDELLSKLYWPELSNFATTPGNSIHPRIVLLYAVSCFRNVA